MTNVRNSLSFDDYDRLWLRSHRALTDITDAKEFRLKQGWTGCWKLQGRFVSYSHFWESNINQWKNLGIYDTKSAAEYDLEQIQRHIATKRYRPLDEVLDAPRTETARDQSQ
jgi:hypothetical protein